MRDFKESAAMVRGLLRACETLAHTRPPVDANGKAIDRAAYMAWLEDCVALAHKQSAPRAWGGPPSGRRPANLTPRKVL